MKLVTQTEERGHKEIILKTELVRQEKQRHKEETLQETILKIELTLLVK